MAGLVWWFTPTITAPEKLRTKGSFKSEANLGDRVSVRPVRAPQ